MKAYVDSLNLKDAALIAAKTKTRFEIELPANAKLNPEQNEKLILLRKDKAKAFY